MTCWIAACVRREMRSAGCGGWFCQKALVARRCDAVRWGDGEVRSAGSGVCGGEPSELERRREGRKSSSGGARRRVCALPEEEEGREVSCNPARWTYAEAGSKRCWRAREVVKGSWGSWGSSNRRQLDADTAAAGGAGGGEGEPLLAPGPDSDAVGRRARWTAS